jgi:BlaI family transcriptional regulator, penicillinase repressor
MEIAFTERELDIMMVLWERGPSTVAEVRSALSDDLARNTVLTMLNVLREKGYVGRDETERTHLYHSTVDRIEAGERALQRLTDTLFRGSLEQLLTSFVRNHNLSKEELRRLRHLLDEDTREVR